MKTSICLTVLWLSAYIVNPAVPPDSELHKAEWLLGTWENKTSRGSIYERWTRKSDLEFAGLSYRMNQTDTVILETIRLVENADGMFYIPTVPNQNQGKPVTFSLKSITSSGMEFSNPAHDFPQEISYTRITPDSLVAEISGMRNGTLRRQTFPMKRIR